MNKSQIQKLIDSPPPSWEKMFKRYKLKKPTVDQLIDTVLEYTPSMASSGARGSAKYKVPAKVKKEAALGLQLAWQHNWTSDSGVGLVRAMQLLVRPKIWERSVRRMKAYFTRHRRDKKFKGFGSKTKPSRGYIAWLAWGGDSGKKWVDGLRLQNPAQPQFFPPDFKKLGMTPVDYHYCLDPIKQSYRSKGGTKLIRSKPHNPLKEAHSKVYFQLHAMKRPWDFYGTIKGRCKAEFKTLSKLFKGDDLGVRVGGPIYSVLQRNNQKWAIEGHKRSLYMTDVVFTVSAALIKTVRAGGDKGPGGYVDGKYEGIISVSKQESILHDWYYNRDYMLQQGYRQVVFNPKFNDSFLYIDPTPGVNPWEYNKIFSLQDRLEEEFPIYTAKEVYLLADPYKLAHPKAKGFPYLMLAWGINNPKDNGKYRIMVKKNVPPPYTITRVGKPK